MDDRASRSKEEKKREREREVGGNFSRAGQRRGMIISFLARVLRHCSGAVELA